MSNVPRRPPCTDTPAAGALAELVQAKVIAAFIREGAEAGMGNALTLKEAVIATHVYLAGAPLGADELSELVKDDPVRIRRRLNHLRKLDWIALQTDPAALDRIMVALSPHGAAVVERWIRRV